MKNQDITENQLKALIYIALHGPCNEYRLREGARLKSYVAHTAPKALVKKGMLKAVPKGKARTGRTIIEYHLTLRGIIAAASDKHVQRRMDRVAEKWKSLAPLVLGKWAVFKRLNLERDMLGLLKVQDTFLSGISSIPEGDSNISTDRAAEIILMAHFGNWVFMSGLRRDRDKWAKVFQEDEELRKWMITELNMRYEKHKYWMQRALEDLAFLKAFESKAKEGGPNV